MKHTWKVKYNGKLDILIFTYFVILLAYFLFNFRLTSKEGGDFFENLWMGIIILFPFLIAAIIVPISMLKNKVILKSVEIDLDKHAVEMTFFKNLDSLQIEIKDLSYQKIESTFFTILVFYQKKIATRGHTLHVELFSIVAPIISTSWKQSQAYEIFNKLKESNIEVHLPVKSKPIIDYILG